MKVQVINKSKHQLPQYATGQSAGMDIRANLDEPIVLKTFAALSCSDRIVYCPSQGV